MAFKLFGFLRDEPPRPYPGGAPPEGSFGAVGMNDETFLDLPGGSTVRVTYRVCGSPRNTPRSTNGIKQWDVSHVKIEVKPVDENTPRLEAVNRGRAMLKVKYRGRGWSEKPVSFIGVPEPGGRYRAQVTGPLMDHEEHVVFFLHDS